jgi:hypothetical protein
MFLDFFSSYPIAKFLKCIVTLDIYGLQLNKVPRVTILPNFKNCKLPQLPKHYFNMFTHDVN